MKKTTKYPHLEAKLEKFVAKHGVEKAMLKDMEAVMASYACTAVENQEVAEEARQVIREFWRDAISRYRQEHTLEL